MKKIFKGLTFGIFLLFVISCKSKFDISRSNYQKSKRYFNYYKELNQGVRIQLSKDTFLLKDNLYLIKSPSGFSIGKMKNKHRRGKWFYYSNFGKDTLSNADVFINDSIKCYKIIRFNNNTEKLIWINHVCYNTRFF